MGGGIDTLAGYGVQAVVLQVPEAQVTRDGKSVSGPTAANAVVGVWASTERRAPAGDERGKQHRARASQRPGCRSAASATR